MPDPTTSPTRQETAEPATTAAATPDWLDTDVARRLTSWGFLAHPDLPDGPGPAFLLVALRRVPSETHFDPEVVRYWVTEDGHGRHRSLAHGSPMPRSEVVSWGSIRIVDRFGVMNEALTFGGRLDAAAIDGVVVAAFTSPAPLLRRGGHSQAWDAGADAVAAFFGRLRIAVDFDPGFEATLAEASPLARYAAFVRDRTERRRPDGRKGWTEDAVGRLLRVEGARLVATAPDDWAAAGELLARIVPQ